MNDPRHLIDLANRIEAGESGLPVNRDIAVAFGWKPIDGPTCVQWWSTPDGRGYALLPEYTTSLDAIESLRQRVLPGWCIWRLREMPNGTWLCLKRRANTDRENGFAPTIAQAYCAAVLRAVAANKETSNAGN